MQFTGERFVPSEQGRIRLEHYHRYAIVLDIIKKKEVLDVACGEGYGSFLISKTARSVTGVDISNETISHASKTYKKSNLSFFQGSATSLNFPDSTFDVVVSFETIEHLAEQSDMIAEIRRVLRPEGVLIISSPNRPIYSEESGEHNEFHVKELDFKELNDLLQVEFPAIKYYGQRMLMGSVIQSFKGGQKNYRAWYDDGKNLVPQSGALQEPVYFIAIAGAQESFLPEIDSSIIHPENLDLVKHYVGFAKWAQDLSTEIDEKNSHIVTLSSELQVRNQQVLAINKVIAERDQIIAERDQQVLAINNVIAERDQQILNLNKFTIENNVQITNLNQTMSERNKEVAELKQAIAEQSTHMNKLDESIAEQSVYIDNLNQFLIERDKQIRDLNDEIVRRGEWGTRLANELAEERNRSAKDKQQLTDKLSEEHQKLADAINSNSWKITLPLRESRIWLSEPKQQFKRYTKKSLRVAKRFYQALPFDNYTRDRHRYLLSEYMPKLLVGSDSNGLYVKDINLHTSDNPLVSIIIPVYGQIGYTISCLTSIIDNPPRFPFEVIVVDDCSPDISFKVLKNVKGIHLLKNKKNLGFIGSCNRGAAAAKGKYLYFLNNDTQVTKGWMDELVRTFHEFPGTGLVGSKLIYSDGSLQEAGGIVWRDGSAWNFGRLQDPQLPIYNYAREVDYCSGASIMVPKELFDGLNGFDSYYSPAYYEDTDLAMKIRSEGYRVIYQPLSTVIHHEGITSGVDIGQGVKSYQAKNAEKFFSRWQERLAAHQPGGVDVDKAKDRRAKRRILMIDSCTPTPNQDAGSLLTYNLLLLMREMDFQVTFVPGDNFLNMPEYTAALQRIGIEALYYPYVSNLEQHVAEYGERYDAVFLFRPDMMDRNLEVIRKHCPKAKLIYHTVDLHYLRMSREAELQQDAEKFKEADIMKEREFAAINASDISIVVSEKELELLQGESFASKLRTFPLILNVSKSKTKFADRRNIVFVGGFQHTPNIDAVQFFVREIMPLVRQKLPDVSVYIVGSKPPDDIQSLASDDVIITGFVEDLDSLLNTMRVSLAPIRYGAGIKGKVGSAMAVGLPVVATNIAVEGMALTDGENILVADEPEKFADAVVRLYQDENLWNEISQNSSEFADNAWGAKSAWKRLSDIFEDLGTEINQSKYPLSLYSEYDLLKEGIK